jgi:ATP-dependent RNA helicase HelY
LPNVLDDDVTPPRAEHPGTARQPRADRDQLLAGYPFAMDRFQTDAFDALDAGRHVVVAAPTGSGKTVVAEYAIAAARVVATRAFYTAPIKALSNQKYRDLVALYGEEQVGLLTGDNSINPDAAIVVMTTEVLRNMIYGGRRSLDDLGVVILDEVHFLQDAYRGPVWEEVIIHLPHHVRLVCLSATVSNSAELSDWISTVRGPTTAVVEQRRPVHLEHLYLVGDRTNDKTHLMPVFVDGRASEQVRRLDASGARSSGGPRRETRRADRLRLFTPGRVEAVRLLHKRDLLPVIYFIFSRNQCDAAAGACLDAGLSLTTAEERERIDQIITERLHSLGDVDLAVLGYTQFRLRLLAGIAAHHAGMVPPFKEVVEACFVEGLTKVVFATETLAVGINMPARTVVIEKLTKFTGDHHESLTPGQFTQLTGRAGRRGIDEIGHAVVAWSPFVSFDQVVELAGSRSFHLRSAFRPTYNMAANLVQKYPAPDAHRLLDLSFAQFQSDRDVVRIEARLEQLRPRHEALRAQATSPFGDIDEYRLASQTPAPGGEDPIEAALSRLRPGDVIHLDTGKHHCPAAVVASGHRKAGITMTVITPGADGLRLTAADFPAPPRPAGTVKLPREHAPDRRDYRREVARRLRQSRITPRGRPHAGRRHAGGVPEAPHPVEADPDLRTRLKAASRAERLEREIADLERRATQHHHSLADEFDRVLEVLASRGYVDRDAWMLSEPGTMLARTFHESDLLVTEVVRAGLLDGLDPAELAGLVSMFVYEHRSPDEPPRPWFPSAQIQQRAGRILAISAELSASEATFGIPPHRAPDPTFLAVAYAWVAGEGFAEVVADEEMTGGDFVRTIKQLIDLLRQVGVIASVDQTRRAARSAAEAAFRGVIADSSVTGVV